jgi:RNA polymerase sigma-70 factor (ECF subfamily)
VSIERTPTRGAAQKKPASRLEEETLTKEQQMQAWGALYKEHLEPIYRYIYSKVGNREEAEDLTEQTFLKAMRSIDYTRTAQSIQKWLFQVARTTIADYWRAYYRLSINSLDELLDSGWEGPLARQNMANTHHDPAMYIQELLALLPVNYREVLSCRFLFNLSIKETASTLGLTEANVKVLQFRALNYAANLEKKPLTNNERPRGE